MDERARIEMLRGIFGAPAGSGVKVGIGDDAAVLDPDLVWTVDAQVEGTHFRREWLSWEDVGWRSVMAAASDLAAMGARPIAALSSLVLADAVDDAALESLARGQRAAAGAIDLPIAGGNLARGRETSVTTSVLGRAARPILRSGAKAGQLLLVSGPLGLAAAGLAALRKSVQDARIEGALAAWRRPHAWIADGVAMAAAGASAAIDVSDGLSRDAAHLADASGVTVVLDGAAIVRHAGEQLAGAAAAILGGDANAARVSGLALELALGGGEDYALLVASASPIEGFTRIGAIDARGPAPVLLEKGGVRTAIEARGFDHFA